MLSLNLSFDFLTNAYDASLETPATSARQQGGGKVKPGAQGGAPVGLRLVLFLDLSGKPGCSLQKPHILAELQHGERIGEWPCSEEGSRGLADTLKAIFSCRSFVSDLCLESKGCERLGSC